MRSPPAASRPANGSDDGSRDVLAVAEAGSVAAASRRTSTTASAMRRRIAKLEPQLMNRAFRRLDGRVVVQVRGRVAANHTGKIRRQKRPPTGTTFIAYPAARLPAARLVQGAESTELSATCAFLSGAT